MASTYLQHNNNNRGDGENVFLLDKLLSLLAPHACLGCLAEGALLCADCSVQLRPAIERCYRCQKPSLSGFTCADCLPASSLLQVRSVTIYDGLASQLVHCLKYDGAVAAAQPMAKLMAELFMEDYLIVPVPTSNARRRQRGYDQAELLARSLSRLTGLPYGRLLARHGERHQIGATRAQRQKQLRDAFRVRRPAPGRTILLIDDVVTTGSTLETAALVLAEAGVGEIRALTFAQA